MAQNTSFLNLQVCESRSALVHFLASSGKMRALATVTVVASFGFVLAIMLTEAAVTKKGLCQGSDKIFALYTDTNQSVGVKKFKGARMEPYAMRTGFSTENPEDLPSDHLFCLVPGEDDQFFLCPNIDGTNVIETSAKTAKLTVNKKAIGVKAIQVYKVVEKLVYAEEPLLSCISFESVIPKYSGRLISTLDLDRNSETKLKLEEPKDDPDDPHQTYILIQVD